MKKSGENSGMSHKILQICENAVIILKYKQNCLDNEKWDRKIQKERPRLDCLV